MQGRNYREIRGMPLTRREYVAGIPNPKIAKFSTGNPTPDYDFKLQAVAQERVQIRHNALEATRVAINKGLASVGEDNYHFLVKVYPHLVLRENKMIATAGADRLQEGMRLAWGKPVGLAARVKPGTVLFELSVKKEALGKAKEALMKAANKLPTPVSVNVVPLKTV